MNLDKQNSRKHSDRNKAAIRKSLETAKAARSIVIDSGDNVLAGNGVAEQWEAMGGKVRVVETSGDELVAVKRVDVAPDSPQARQIATLDNLVADTSAFDYDAERLREALANDPVSKAIAEQDERLRKLLKVAKPESVDAGELVDKAAQLQEKWQVKRGDLWQCGKHRILCGDSTNAADVARLMQGEKAQAVVTDSPYNVAYSSRGSNKDNWGKIENDEMSDDDFYSWLLIVAKSIDSVLSNGASIYLCHGDTDRKSIPFVEVFKAMDWKRSATIIWAKQVASMGWQDYRSQHECISYGWKQGAEHYFTDDRSQTTLWNIDRDAQAKYEHPTQKPVALFTKAIDNSTKTGAIIFDPFLGSGTTLIAAEQTGRIGRGVEIEPKYVAVSLERLSNLGLTCERIEGANNP